MQKISFLDLIGPKKASQAAFVFLHQGRHGSLPVVLILAWGSMFEGVFISGGIYKWQEGLYW